MARLKTHLLSIIYHTGSKKKHMAFSVYNCSRIAVLHFSSYIYSIHAILSSKHFNLLFNVKNNIYDVTQKLKTASWKNYTEVYEKISKQTLAIQRERLYGQPGRETFQTYFLTPLAENANF